MGRGSRARLGVFTWMKRSCGAGRAYSLRIGVPKSAVLIFVALFLVGAGSQLVARLFHHSITKDPGHPCDGMSDVGSAGRFDAHLLPLEIGSVKPGVSRPHCPRLVGSLNPRSISRPLGSSDRPKLDLPRPNFKGCKLQWGNDREGCWDTACHASEVDDFVLGPSVHHEPPGEPVVVRSSRGARRVVLFARCGCEFVNVWHLFFDTPVFWCVSRFAQHHPALVSDPDALPWQVSLVLYEDKPHRDSVDPVPAPWRARTRILRLLEGIFERVFVDDERGRRFLREEADGRMRLFSWKPLDTSKLKSDRDKVEWRRRSGCVGADISGEGIVGMKTDILTFARTPDPFRLGVMRRTRRSMGVGERFCDEGHVLVLERSTPFGKSSRRLLAEETGDLAGVLSALCDRGLEVVATDLVGVPMREQVRLFAHAAVLVAVHGAGIANLVFMRPRSVVIEVNLRTSDRSKPASEQGTYPLLVYPDTAITMGMYYYTHDPVAIYPPFAYEKKWERDWGFWWRKRPVRDYRATTAVYVNASQLAEQALGGWYAATRCTL